MGVKKKNDISKTPHGGKYVPGVMHNHQPSGRWDLIQENPQSGYIRCSTACRFLSPMSVVQLANSITMSGKPLAKNYLNHFLYGRGRDKIVDIEDFIKNEKGIRTWFEKILLQGVNNHGKSISRNHFKWEQDRYNDPDSDYCFAFGAIDRIDYEVDWNKNTIHIWFLDRYEFHPVYKGLYVKMPGDVKRVTNCVHAACVELKSQVAKDFWMRGYGEIPFHIISKSPLLKSGKKRRASQETPDNKKKEVI